MIVIKEKADIKIEYPIETISDKDQILFFDIETTGFSRQYCNIYLIGCLYFCDNQPMYAQWLAENFNEEANILMAFHKFIQKYTTLIHFNGNSFDIPFIKERGEKYHLDFNFNQYKSIDIYKPVSRLNHIFKMENQKQKTFEKLLGINRSDPFSGGDLIEVFKHYVESKDERLLFPLLLHNKEDVWNMGILTSLLSFSDLFDHKYSVENYKRNSYKDINGDSASELTVELVLDNPVPIPVSYGFDLVYFKVSGIKAYLSIKIKSGTYKYFFHNYKDYYYLPLEDKAIHKSLSSFVDKKYRKPATASTCYEKACGDFLPIYNLKSSDFEHILKEMPKSTIGYIQLSSINDNNIEKYCNMIIDSIKEKRLTIK